MALTAEQNATLQLLLERDQSYPDLAKLLNVDESEVRSRARAALTELAGADPDRNVALTDYLVGQADPIGRADAVRHLRDDPEDLRLVQDLVDTLRSTYPSAALPRLPGEARAPRRARAAEDGAEGGARPLPSLANPQARLAAILAAGGLILIVAVLAIAGVFGGDDDPAAGEATTTTAAETPAGEEIERVALRSPGGGDATGEALFGLTDEDQAFLDLSITGLDAAPRDQTYVLWLLLNEREGYPLTPLATSENGTYQNRLAIPAAVLPIVARVRTVDISIAPVNEVRDTVQRALENEQLVLDKPGETVLTGAVPRIRAQQGGG
ncbi:MAG TPA: hypothetical protein VHF58_10425 [Solirubrobacterales bacterium]|nr:hypothetical protein [Solirubrobacterales bacterium]